MSNITIYIHTLSGVAQTIEVLYLFLLFIFYFLKDKDEPSQFGRNISHAIIPFFFLCKHKLGLNEFTKTNNVFPKEATKRPKPLHIIK